MSLRLVFWLLDTNYVIRESRAVIQLWGITRDEQRVLIEVTGFEPYFYLVLNRPDDDQNTLIEQVCKHTGVTKAESVNRRFFGTEIKVIKVTVEIPGQVPDLRETLSDIEDVSTYLEADVRFALRHLIDKKVYPCRWHEIDVVDNSKAVTENDIGIDAIYEAKSDPILTEDEDLPDLRVLAFDIETYNPRGTPNAKRGDPIIIISTTIDRESKLFVANGNEDRDVLDSFINYFMTYDPDIVVSYAGNVFDWPYIIERAKMSNIKLNLGRDQSPPSPSAMRHISIKGRANVDLFDLARHLEEVKVRTLEDVADYLGVMKKTDRVHIDHLEIAGHWDDPGKRNILLEYARQDAESTYGMSEKLLPFAIQMATIAGIPLDQVMAASTGFRIEFYLMREAFQLGELVPNRSRRTHKTYAGGFVLDPVPGLHEQVAIFDFSSMYPNLMISRNISPDTYVSPDETLEKSVPVIITPEVGHKFRQDFPGFYKRILRGLLDARHDIRDRMKEFSKESIEYKLLEERQRAVKILANAAYGYTGWALARWYLRPVAEATAAFGRQAIKQTIEIAENLGLKVLYGDTDSIFVVYDPGKVDEFQKRVQTALDLEIKPDKIFRRMFFTGAKKRYGGLFEDGTIDITGLEKVRGDWTDLAKEVQEKVIEEVLLQQSPEGAVRYVQKVIRDLDAGQIPIEKFVIWKTITMSIRRYKVTAAHVEAAKILEEHGEEIKPGDKIGYVIIKGSEILAKRARPHNLVQEEDLDLTYYKEKQVLPVVLRILTFFGVTESQILTGKKQASLDKFFAC